MDFHYAYGDHFISVPPFFRLIGLTDTFFHDVLKLFLVQVFCIDCGKSHTEDHDWLSVLFGTSHI